MLCDPSVWEHETRGSLVLATPGCLAYLVNARPVRYPNAKQNKPQNKKQAKTKRGGQCLGNDISIHTHTHKHTRSNWPYSWKAEHTFLLHIHIYFKSAHGISCAWILTSVPGAHAVVKCNSFAHSSGWITWEAVFLVLQCPPGSNNGPVLERRHPDCYVEEQKSRKRCLGTSDAAGSSG